MTAVRHLAYERSEGRCERCGTALGLGWDGWSAHHRQPRGMGGTKAVDRACVIVALCGSGTTGCHGEIESFRSDAYDDGWLVRRPTDPLTVPIRHWWHGLVLLADDWCYEGIAA